MRIETRRVFVAVCGIACGLAWGIARAAEVSEDDAREAVAGWLALGESPSGGAAAATPNTTAWARLKTAGQGCRASAPATASGSATASAPATTLRLR